MTETIEGEVDQKTEIPQEEVSLPFEEGLYPTANRREAIDILKEELFAEKEAKGEKPEAAVLEHSKLPIRAEGFSFETPRRLPVQTKEKPKLNWWQEFKHDFFWTEKKKKEAERLNEAINRYVAKFGGQPVDFDTSETDLFTPLNLQSFLAFLKGGRLAGFYNFLTGKTAISLFDAEADFASFRHTFVHEGFHRRSLGLVKGITSLFVKDKHFGDLPEILRKGLAMKLKAERREKFKTRYVFSSLTEAIVDRATEKVLEEEKKREEYGVLSYLQEKELYGSIVSNIGQYQKIVIDKPLSRERIEEAFEKATFCEGHALSMARLIDKAYKDIGGFRVFAEKMMTYDSYKAILNPFKKNFSEKVLQGRLAVFNKDRRVFASLFFSAGATQTKKTKAETSLSLLRVRPLQGTDPLK